jgi:hypothetical protein
MNPNGFKNTMWVSSLSVAENKCENTEMYGNVVANEFPIGLALSVHI